MESTCIVWDKVCQPVAAIWLQFSLNGGCRSVLYDVTAFVSDSGLRRVIKTQHVQTIACVDVVRKGYVAESELSGFYKQ